MIELRNILLAKLVFVALGIIIKNILNIILIFVLKKEYIYNITQQAIARL